MEFDSLCQKCPVQKLCKLPCRFGEVQTCNAYNEVVAVLEKHQDSESVAPPKMLAQPNFDALKRTCQFIIDEVVEKGYSNEDNPHYVYEEAMQALFGPDIFKWINANNKG